MEFDKDKTMFQQTRFLVIVKKNNKMNMFDKLIPIF